MLKVFHQDQHDQPTKINNNWLIEWFPYSTEIISSQMASNVKLLLQSHAEV